MPMMFLSLGIQAKWSRLSRLPRNGKTIHIRRTAQLVAIPYYMTRLTALPTDINLSLGSIFAIRQQQGNDTDGSASDLLQDGRKQIAAGYILYGPSTMLVYSIGKGVHSFARPHRRFILSDENIQIPMAPFTASMRVILAMG